MSEHAVKTNVDDAAEVDPDPVSSTPENCQWPDNNCGSLGCYNYRYGGSRCSGASSEYTPQSPVDLARRIGDGLLSTLVETV